MMHENPVSVTGEISLYLITRERGITLTTWLGESMVSILSSAVLFTEQLIDNFESSNMFG